MINKKKTITTALIILASVFAVTVFSGCIMSERTQKSTVTTPYIERTQETPLATPYIEHIEKSDDAKFIDSVESGLKTLSNDLNMLGYEQSKNDIAMTKMYGNRMKIDSDDQLNILAAYKYKISSDLADTYILYEGVLDDFNSFGQYAARVDYNSLDPTYSRLLNALGDDIIKLKFNLDLVEPKITNK